MRDHAFPSHLNFSFLENPHYLATHLILDRVTGEHKLKDFEFAFLELPKFQKKESELTTIEEKWIYFLKHASRTPIREIPASLHEPDIEEAFGVLEKIGRSETETRLYQKADMDRMDRIAEIGKGYEEGHEEGHKKGHKKGREEGRKEGREEGRQEGRQEEKLQIARKMRASGSDDKTIIDITGLTREQLETLD